MSLLNIRSDTELNTKLNKKEFKPNIIAFCCNWCSYAGSDLAGVSRLEYPVEIKIIRVPCSGRVDPVWIIKAFQEGADGVMVAGCHSGDCHYISGNLFAERRILVLKELLRNQGIDEKRLILTWISASEPAKFASVTAEITAQIRELGPLKRQELLC